MTKYDITNEAKGARGIIGFIVEAGASAEGVDLTDEQALLLGDMDGVTVVETKAKPDEKQPAKAKPDAE